MVVTERAVCIFANQKMDALPLNYFDPVVVDLSYARQIPIATVLMDPSLVVEFAEDALKPLGVTANVVAAEVIRLDEGVSAFGGYRVVARGAATSSVSTVPCEPVQNNPPTIKNTAGQLLSGAEFSFDRAHV